MKHILFTFMLLLASLAGHTQQTNEKSTMNRMENKPKILVAFFSRADENYAVGYIEKGNTHIVAEMIGAETGADLFHIETVNPYPAAYNQCIEVAKREKESNVRPEIKGDKRIEDYDVIFLGYPNWWVRCRWLSIPSSRNMIGKERQSFLSVPMKVADSLVRNVVSSRLVREPRCSKDWP